MWRLIARQGASVLQDGVEQAIRDRLLAAHEPVPIGIGLDPLHWLARVLRQDLVQPLASVQDLAGVDVDVGGRSLETPERLVDQYP